MVGLGQSVHCLEGWRWGFLKTIGCGKEVKVEEGIKGISGDGKMK